MPQRSRAAPSGPPHWYSWVKHSSGPTKWTKEKIVSPVRFYQQYQMLRVTRMLLCRAFWISKSWLTGCRCAFAFFATASFVGSPDHLLSSWLCSCLNSKKRECTCFSVGLQTQRGGRKKWGRSFPNTAQWSPLSGFTSFTLSKSWGLWMTLKLLGVFE